MGNREGVIKGGTWVEYTANPLNQYSSVDGAYFSCDTNGNLTDDGTHTYYYDLDNRLTKIIRNSDSQVIAEYKYDPFGRRIQKLINVPSYQLINYLYDGGRVIEERDGSNNLIQRYIYGVGIDEAIFLEKANGDRYWYYYDALGNVVNLTDNNGNLACTYYYDVYGDFTESGTFTDNPYKFTGRRYDPESDLYFYRARMYSPELGRFMQTDPVGYVDGPNLYTYVSNNPLNLIDPLGLKPPPVIPTGVDVQKNIWEACNMTLLEFYDAVKGGGKWDYKRLGSKYEDFGNYHYGVVGRAAGFSAEILKRAAGAYQIYSGTSESRWGWPWGGSPHGDQPRDQWWITEGMKDYDTDYYEKCGEGGGW